jgi:hypothetical protein
LFWSILEFILYTDAKKEVRMLRADTLREIDKIVTAARLKYPDSSPTMRANGVVQEFGEALQALAKWQLNPTPDTVSALRMELTQAIGVGIRFLDEVLL